jgi:hypothetical protein
MKCFVVALFKIISRHFYGDSEKYHEEILKIQLEGLKIELGTTRVIVKIITASAKFWCTMEREKNKPLQPNLLFVLLFVTA